MENGVTDDLVSGLGPDESPTPFHEAMFTRCEQVIRRVREGLPQGRVLSDARVRSTSARSTGHAPQGMCGPPYFAPTYNGAPLEGIKECIRAQKRPDQACASFPS